MRSPPPHQHALRGAVLGGAALWLLFSVLGGCGQTVVVGVDDAADPGGAGTVAGSGGAGDELALAGNGPSVAAGEAATAGGAPACVSTACRGNYYECGDCKDNDGDGKIDALDPECLGPCDNDEEGFSTGLAMSGGAPCRLDCYFDGDSGPGNDQCEWSQQCDPLSVAPDYPPSGEQRCAYGVEDPGKEVDCAALAASQSAVCVEQCLPLAPNGCDCFGCCELPSRSGQYHFIGRGRGSLGCSLDALDDPAACPPCTRVESCFNECKPCEVCVGSGVDPTCQKPVVCASGQACSADAPCSAGDYCVTGCCVRAPEPR